MPTARLSHAHWRKSSHSASQEGACVELAALTGRVGVRDSKDPAGPILQLDRRALSALATRIREGELDL